MEPRPRNWLEIDMRELKRQPVVTVNDDKAFTARVKHAMKPKETNGEFVARSGLGPTQAAGMTKDEITNFVERAERARAAEHLEPVASFVPLAMPTKFSVPFVLTE